jgi:hypothetical protein
MVNNFADSDTSPIWLFSTAKLQTPENQSNEIWQSAIAKLEEWSTPADWLFNKLNYTSCLFAYIRIKSV